MLLENIAQPLSCICYTVVTKRVLSTKSVLLKAVNALGRSSVILQGRYFCEFLLAVLHTKPF